jgi:two-component system sensor histidine kinase YesM
MIGAIKLLRLIQRTAKTGELRELEESPLWNSKYGAAMRGIVEQFVSAATKQETEILNEHQARLFALQSQINPHFLYNTLDCIRGQAMLDDNREIAQMLEALSDLFRYSISRKDNLVLLREELNSAENYMFIQQYRFNERYQYSVNFLGNKNEILDCYVPKLILQPIIENAILHGLEKKSSGSITVVIDFSEDMLLINVSDDGIGIEEDDLKAIFESIEGAQLPVYVSGIALPNINRRIRMLFGEKYGIHLYSTPNKGCDVEIILPRIVSKDTIDA